jgi:hypothetical protein
MARLEASPSPVYGAALLMRLGREALPGSNPGASAARHPPRRFREGGSDTLHSPGLQFGLQLPSSRTPQRLVHALVDSGIPDMRLAEESSSSRLGLLYADGRRGATTGGHWRPDRDDDPGRLVLEDGSSGGTARRWDGNFWVHPLPPAGPVTFVASWPEYGVAETRAVLDGTAIRAAAARAVILWPEEP